jgi:hypothetical protein
LETPRKLDLVFVLSICRSNSSFSFVANLAHLVTKHERDAAPKARLEFTNAQKTEVAIDGKMVSLQNLKDMYKTLIVELDRQLRVLTFGVRIAVDVKRLASEEQPNNSNVGFGSIPDASSKLVDHLFTLQGQGRTAFSLS